MKKWFLLLTVLAALFLNACDNSKRSKKWEEEVLLHDDTVFWVKRTAQWEVGGDGINSGGFYNIQNTVTIPENIIATPPPKWEGFKGSDPILLDYDEEKKTWFVVATFVMTGVWVEWGRPRVPYRQYEVQNGQWVIVPFDEKLLGRNTNLLAEFSKKTSSRVTVQERLKLQHNSAKRVKILTDEWGH